MLYSRNQSGMLRKRYNVSNDEDMRSIDQIAHMRNGAYSYIAMILYWQVG